MLWFLRGIRKGIVTTRYPRERDDWTLELPSPPVFRTDLLTPDLVERLTSSCPTGALTRDASDLVLDLGACVGCGICAELGGDAVAPSGEFELASRDRAALLKRLPIGGRA
jgi:ferredoxin-like protein FixX